ncbi:MAG: hypothetical protein RI883_2328 [Bacteroidota bacterium]|jgi:hypothetical protein
MKIIIFLFYSQIIFSQIDSTQNLRDKFYLELNAGIGSFNYSYLYNPKPTTSSGTYIDDKSLFFNFDMNFNFRNNYFKIGGTIFSTKIIEGTVDGAFAISLGGNLVFFEPKDKYFGPYLSYGKLIYKMENPWFEYLGFGLETYIRKFHLEFYYNKAINVPDTSTKINKRMFGFNIGYAFNLESFRKKK